MDYDPSGRIKRIPAGIMMPPGLCAVCNTNHGTEFADLDTHIDLWGAVYLCKACVLQAASIWGLLTDIEEAALRDEINKLRDLHSTAEQRAIKAESLNESYRAAIVDLRSDDVRGTVDAPDYLYDVPPTDKPDGEASPDDGREPDEPSDDSVQESGEPERDAPEDSAATADDPEPGDDGVSEAALERAFESLIGDSGDSSESPAEQDGVGCEPVGRLFGE